MNDIVIIDSLVRHKVDGRIMLVKAIFHDEDESSNLVECELYEGGALITVLVPLSELETMTRF